MKYISYNKEMLAAQAEMIRLFSNITIISKGKKILVPCVFGQTSRIFKSIMNPQGSPQIYPIISLERNHISLDLRRNCEINHDVATMTSLSNYDPDTRPPTPIDVEYQIHIFSKYPEEMDMILSNFIPFINKDVFVTSPHPKLKDRYLNHQVIWNGNVAVEWKNTLQSSEQDIQVATTTFTYKTELFGGTDKLTEDNEGKILKINMSLSPSDGTDYPEFDPTAKNGNIAGGFFAVPLSVDFEKYADNIIQNYISSNGAECDNYLVYTAYNAMFNSAVLNNDLTAMKEAVDNGANIYKNSYWAYKYADNHKMEEVKEWLKENGALIPTSEEHYPSAEKIHISDFDTFSKENNS